jgi:hypothetical protein
MTQTGVVGKIGEGAGRGWQGPAVVECKAGLARDALVVFVASTGKVEVGVAI